MGRGRWNNASESELIINGKRVPIIPPIVTVVGVARDQIRVGVQTSKPLLS